LLDKHRRYNVLGQDSFSEIEFLSKPLQLKKNDLIVIMSEGIFNTLRWVEIESVLEQKKSAQKLADEIIRLANNSSFVSRENGTILICKC
jgi:serine/threonine protein phosphatase PrpC